MKLPQDREEYPLHSTQKILQDVYTLDEELMNNLASALKNTNEVDQGQPISPAGIIINEVNLPPQRCLVLWRHASDMNQIIGPNLAEKKEFA